MGGTVGSPHGMGRVAPGHPGQQHYSVRDSTTAPLATVSGGSHGVALGVIGPGPGGRPPGPLGDSLRHARRSSRVRGQAAWILVRGRCARRYGPLPDPAPLHRGPGHYVYGANHYTGSLPLPGCCRRRVALPLDVAGPTGRVTGPTGGDQVVQGVRAALVTAHWPVIGRGGPLAAPVTGRVSQVRVIVPGQDQAGQLPVLVAPPLAPPRH
jgi:hypothetical protein